MVQLRTYYFDTESITSGAKSEAWAVGGWAGVRSPWWGDLFQVGVLGYTSQKLYGPDDKDGTKLLMPGQKSFAVLGEAWGALKVFDQTLTGYRQLVNRPYINPQDNRMVPNTFEAYTLSGAASGVSYTGGYIAKMKTRDSDSFDWMSTAAGSKGTHKGVGFAGVDLGLHEERLRQGGRAVRLRPLQHLLRRRQVPDRDRRPDPAGARRAIHARRSRSARSSSAPSRPITRACRPPLSSGPFGAQLYYTQNGNGFDSQNPFGDHAVVPQPDAGALQYRRREDLGHRRQRQFRQPGRARAHRRGDLCEQQRSHRRRHRCG